MVSLFAQKDSCIFCDVKSFCGFFLCETAEILIVLQQDLILVAVAGEDVFDQRLRLIKRDGIFIAQAADGSKKKAVKSVCPFSRPNCS